MAMDRTGGKPAPYEEARIDTSLFDLETDAGETTDVKERHPDIVAKMEKLAAAMRRDLGDSATKTQGSEVRPPRRL